MNSFFFSCSKISSNIIILYVDIVLVIPDYDSDDEPPCLPGGNSGSDSEDEEKNGRPAAKSSRPGLCYLHILLRLDELELQFFFHQKERGDDEAP